MKKLRKFKYLFGRFFLTIATNDGIFQPVHLHQPKAKHYAGKRYLYKEEVLDRIREISVAPWARPNDKDRWLICLWFLKDHTYEEFIDAWQDEIFSQHAIRSSQKRKPIIEKKDNQSAILHPGQGGRGMRVPRKSASKRAWRNFFRLFPDALGKIDNPYY